MTLQEQLSYRMIKRSIKHFFQRRFRGWDDTETYNVNTTCARFLFKELNKLIKTDYCPSGMLSAEWNMQLRIMLNALDLYVQDGEGIIFHIAKSKKKHRRELFLEGEAAFWRHLRNHNFPREFENELFNFASLRISRMNEIRFCFPIDSSDEEWGEILNRLALLMRNYAAGDGNEDDFLEVVGLFQKWFHDLWW